MMAKIILNDIVRSLIEESIGGYMKKISSVFWITLALVFITVLFGALAPDEL